MTERDQGVTVELCGTIDAVLGPGLGPVCTRPKGHDGDHEAVCPATGRHVSTWADLPGDGLCWICDAVDPGPCLVHGEPEVATRCRLCFRDAYAGWIANLGDLRLCDGSGERDHEQRLACPGCVACTTSETPCPAFALPDEPWISPAERDAPCVACGQPGPKHRPMPPTSYPSHPGGIVGLKTIDADGAELGTVGDVLRGPR